MRLLDRLLDREPTEVALYRPATDLPETAAAYINELRVIEHQLSLHPPIIKQKHLLKRHLDGLLEIMRAFEAGFEPTTPNQDWFFGGVNEPLSVRSSPFDSRRIYDGLSLFKGLMPVAVQESYLRAVPIFGVDNIAVYSPTADDFKITRPITMAVDPAMIGYIRRHSDLGGGVFFEIARWDVMRDLEALKGLLSSGRPAATEADEVYDPPRSHR